MNKEFISYEQALALKELGFDEPCLASWNFYTRELNYNGQPSIFSSEDVIQLPTFSQAFRWFREKYGYYYEIFVDDDKTFGFMISYFIEIGRADKPIQRMYTTYEEAELECLKKLIEIVKGGQDA
jgi:hypothetical protein